MQPFPQGFGGQDNPQMQPKPQGIPPQMPPIPQGQRQEFSGHPLPPPPPPAWFVEPTLKADEQPAQRAKACHDVAVTGKKELSYGPVILPEDQEPQICIFFPQMINPQRPQQYPAAPSGMWMGDVGRKGACANKCCEFLPPPPPQMKDYPAPMQYPAWFEIKADEDCSKVPAEVNKAPTFFSGGKVGDVKTICYSTGPGAYRKDAGKLLQCSAGGYCLFFPDHQPQQPQYTHQHP